jgi:ComF family protein
VLPQLTKITGAALNLLYPQKCLGCGREGELICESCRAKLPRLSPPLCPRCGRPQPSGMLCPDCISRNTCIDGLRAPFKFEGLARECVHQLKYKNLRSVAQSLSSFMADYFRANPLPVNTLIAVPLHPKRLKERGYNQSDLLASHLANRLDLTVDRQSLVRRRYVLPQARTASAVERRRNVHQAFESRALPPDRAVLLIDDVATSGATLEACAAALKAAGARSVWGLVFAREI